MVIEITRHAFLFGLTIWLHSVCPFVHVRPIHPIRLRFVRPRLSCKDVLRICSDMSFLGNPLTRQLSCFTFFLAALHVCVHFLKTVSFLFPCIESGFVLTFFQCTRRYCFRLFLQQLLDMSVVMKLLDSAGHNGFVCQQHFR